MSLIKCIEFCTVMVKIPAPQKVASQVGHFTVSNDESPALENE